MQTNPAAEQNKIVRWSESPWNQSDRKGKGLRILLKSQVLSSDWKCISAYYSRVIAAISGSEKRKSARRQIHYVTEARHVIILFQELHFASARSQGVRSLSSVGND